MLGLYYPGNKHRFEFLVKKTRNVDTPHVKSKKIKKSYKEVRKGKNGYFKMQKEVDKN